MRLLEEDGGSIHGSNSDDDDNDGATTTDAGLSTRAVFAKAARTQKAAIEKRDAEDASEVAAGIKAAVAAAVLPELSEKPRYTPVDVLGKTPSEVAEFIESCVGADAAKGCVVVICGLSGKAKRNR